MAGYIRLRQICLVAEKLEPVASDIADIMGLKICYRDPYVGKYGLENALLPVGTTLLEVVAPLQPGTAAGRFLDKTDGRGGYMAIFCCDDPDARGRNAEALGVRIANVIDHPPYHGVQLHPRDCRAAFIEFNHSEGSDDIAGPYPPAGPDWHKAIRAEVTRALIAVEMQSPDPLDLAQHWGRIIGIPASTDVGGPEIALPNCVLRFVKGERDALSALTFTTNDMSRVRNAATARGLPMSGDCCFLAGVDFRFAA